MKKNRIGLLKERKIMNKKIVSPSQSQGRKIQNQDKANQLAPARILEISLKAQEATIPIRIVTMTKSEQIIF